MIDAICNNSSLLEADTSRGGWPCSVTWNRDGNRDLMIISRLGQENKDKFYRRKKEALSVKWNQ